MSGTRTLIYPAHGVPDVGRSFRSMFSGLPIGLINAVGEDGTGGAVGFFEDFMVWSGPVAEGAAGGWLLSGPTGTATIVLTDDRQGIGVLTTDATGSAVATLHAAGATTAENFIYSATKRLWCFGRFKLLTVASMELFLGIGTGDTSPTTTGTFPSDGIFFEKATTATDFDFHARKDGTSTEKTSVGVTLTDDTYLTLGFTVDATGNIMPYWNGTALTSKAIAAGTANIPASTDPMQFMIGHLGASMTTTIDWLLCYQER